MQTPENRSREGDDPKRVHERVRSPAAAQLNANQDRMSWMINQIVKKNTTRMTTLIERPITMILQEMIKKVA
jgi:hypothetical protein